MRFLIVWLITLALMAGVCVLAFFAMLGNSSGGIYAAIVAVVLGSVIIAAASLWIAKNFRRNT